MLLRVAITILCGVGCYVSLFMLAKARRAERGLLTEPSVVQRPAARLYFGLSNSLLGLVYYVVLAVAIWFAHGWALVAILLIAALAAITSLALAYSLLFRTRMPCPYCWTAHAVNWALAILCWRVYLVS
jgi:uncharacterized membrane protein